MRQSRTQRGPGVHLFFGYGSEYSLHPLYSYMTANGDACIEVDMLTHPDTTGVLRDLEGGVATFITSAHLLYDARNFFFYRTGRKIISPLHIISTLAPTASVYYPHDLHDPVKPEEELYLPLFNLLLGALPEMDRFNAYLPVFDVGWIKRTPKTQPTMPADFNPSRAVFFTGAFQKYLNRGFQPFYAEFKPLFDAGVAVKFPIWHGTDEFEDFLRTRGVRVYPSAANSIHVIEENDLIYTQALSSVNTEACALGKKVCYIRDTALDYKDPVVELRRAGTIAFVDSPQEAATLPFEKVPNNDASMGYFDFARARNAVLSLTAEGSE